MQLTKKTQIKSQENRSGKLNVYFKLGAYALTTAVERDLPSFTILSINLSKQMSKPGKFHNNENKITGINNPMY